MIHAAILSFWHVHARDYARQASEHPDVELVAAWDEDPGRGRAESGEYGLAFCPDLDEVLARDDIDAVIVTAPTSMHRDVLVAAARAGKHIFTEKVIAATVSECDEILAAVGDAGVVLTVSLPRLYDGYTQTIRQLIDDRRFGDLTLVRVRLSHGGALGAQPWLPARFFDLAPTAGGALIDLGCHPMYLTRLFLGGLPATVSASYGHITGRAVEDNAVAVLQHPGGALGVVEAGFVNRCSPFTIEVHGTDASLLYGTPQPRLMFRDQASDAWAELAVAPPLPPPFAQFVRHIQQGTKATENIGIGADLTRLMEAAGRSAATGGVIGL
jgi:1,5-anhydro-D-fructose reductase (1,5-anhydro-D-mannitol-forming)